MIFEVSMHQCREQYAAFTYLQTRAQQIFGVAAVIAGILTTVLIGPHGPTTVPLWMLSIIGVAFVVLSIMCMLVLGSENWVSGPQLDKLVKKLPCVREDNHSVPLWLAMQMNLSYKCNKSVQSHNACYLNIAIICLITMVVAMLVAACTVMSAAA